MSSQIRVHDVIVGENDGFADVVFTLSAPADATVSVDWTTIGGTATAANNTGYDFFSAHGTLVFAAGETTKTVRVQLADDTAAEVLQSFSIGLANALGATLASTRALVTVVDDDAPAGVPTASVRDLVVDERDGSARFAVVLDRPSDSGLSVTYATADGGAVEGSDYTATSGTLVFAPGQTVAHVSVPLLDDAVIESDELFELRLTDAVDAVLGQAAGTARIGASDRAATSAPLIRVDDAVVGESAGFAELVFRLSAPSTGAVKFDWIAAGGSAVAANGSGWDFSGASGSIEFAPGETVRTLRIDLLSDGTTEPRQSFTVNLSNASGGTLAQSRALVTLVDDDAATGVPRLSVSEAVVDERDGVASFVVTLDRPSDETLVVSYDTRDGKAQAGSDFAARSGTLVFLPGETAKSIDIAIVDDATAEGVEDFALTLLAEVGGSAVRAEAQALIGASDRAASSLPALRVADVVVGEGQGWAELVFTLSAPSTQAVSVAWSTANGSATAFNNSGYDFHAASGTLRFAPGETTRTVRIDLASDAVAEALQSFAVNLSAASGAVLERTRALVSVVDDDAAPGGSLVTVSDAVVDERAGHASFTVRLDRPSDVPLELFWASVQGSASAGSDFVPSSGWLSFDSGETVKTVFVPIVDDTAAEGIESFDLVVAEQSNLTGVRDRGTALIGASDGTATSAPLLRVSDAVVGEHDGVAEVVLTLSAPATQRVSVNWATGSGGAVPANTAGFDYFGANGTITFGLGETTKTLRIDLADDTAAEALQSFAINFSGAAGATLDHTRALVTVVDDDGPAGVPGASVSDVVVDERAGVARFVVTLDRPAADAVSLGYATVNPGSGTGFALEGEDFRATQGTLVFAPGETAKTVSVLLVDDAAIEGAELFELALANPVGATLTDARGAVLIGASDAAGSAAPLIRVADVVASESDGAAELVFTLSAPSTQAVSARWSSGAGSALAFNNSGHDFFNASGTVTFAPGETTKTVRIELADDTAAEPRQSFPVALSGASGGTLERTSALVTIVDDDAAAGRPFVSAGDATVDEHAGVARFTVTLDRPATAAVSVDFTTAANGAYAGSATAGSDFTPRQGTLGFAPGETVKTVVVPITSDGAAEGAELFNLVLSNASGAAIADATGTAVIGANDGTAVAMPLIRVADVVAAEGDGVAELVFSLSAPSTQAASVRWGAGSGSAVAASASGFDFHAYSGTVTFAPGETTRTVRIDLADDTAAEPLQSLVVSLGDASGAALERTSALVTLVDDDAATGTPGLRVRDAVVDETSGIVEFALTLDRPSTARASVWYSLPDGAGATHPLVFEPGETLKTVSFAITDDALAEGNEWIDLKVSHQSGLTLIDPSGRARIGGSDQVNATLPAIRVDDVAVAESDGWVDVMLTLSAPSAQEVSVAWATAAATAVPANNTGADYIVGNGTVRFAPGQTTAVVRVAIIDAADAEPTQHFWVLLSNPVNATRASDAATVTILDDDSGARVMSWGYGDDRYTVTATTDVIVENPQGGSDSVSSRASYVLPANVEDLTLTGTAAIDATGNDLPNRLSGNTAANTLDGRGGADTMTGSGGNDTYVVDHAGDVVSEWTDQGSDLVRASASFVLPANVESLVLTGGAAIAGTGNDLPNRIDGNAAANVIDGKAGADTMTGGDGDDTYRLDRQDDVIVEGADGGNDTVISVFSYTLPADLENLTLNGNYQAGGGGTYDGTGNAVANRLVGDGGPNRLVGLAGNDTLDGRAGDDTMVGGIGDDTFHVDSLFDSIVELPGQGTDLVISSVDTVLTLDFENLTLTGTARIGSGNVLPNRIVGNELANTLTGDAGDDALLGGAGNDRLKGGAGHDTLEGGPGTDTLEGGGGNDLYIVSIIGNPAIVELGGAGNDTVESSVGFTLPEWVEQLKLVGTDAIDGTGNSLANRLTGNAVANRLTGLGGSDTLDGGGGADTLTGGGGNDVYFVDGTSDQIVELADGGIDQVVASLNWTLGAELERLTLTGYAFSGTGNGLANLIEGNASGNRLTGGGGADTLRGGAGNDTLTGGSGADRFVVDSLDRSDSITDFATGIDRIELRSTVVRVGNGDPLLQGQTMVTGPGGFSPFAELVVVTKDIVGPITASSAAAAIGQANAPYLPNQTALFAVDNGSYSALFLFKSLDAGVLVEAGELTLLLTMTTTPATTIIDYVLG